MPETFDLTKKLSEQFRTVRLVVFDFDGVFTDNTVWVAEDGTEMVRCSRSDGLGLQKLDKLGVHRMVLSTETNPVVSARSRKLKMKCIQSCSDKLGALESVAAEYNLRFSQIAFVGNDINDMECLKKVGLPMVVCDAHEDVLPYAAYITRHSGGHGAVREICDMISSVHDQSF